ncbi:hypothetical protein Tco_0611971, partial [Tanacetum coccineum]
MPDLCFFDLDFRCPPALPLLSDRAFVLCEDALLLRCFSEADDVPLEREL